MSEQAPDTRMYDIIIAGGGVIGSSIAYFLAAEPAFDGRVAVIEPAPSYAHASTSLSAGGVRHQFSSAENIRMSLFATEFLRTIGERLAVDDIVPDVGFHENGYLFLATEPGRDVLQHNHALQTEQGADIEWLDSAALAARFPELATADLAAGTYGRSGEGWLNPYGLLQAFKRKARALGVTYIEDEVTGVDVADGRVTAAECAQRGRLDCGLLINAVGARGAARLAALAGIDDLPVRPRKRCMFVFEAAGAGRDWPLTVDPSGVYFRPEGDQFVCGVGPEPDPDCKDFDVDTALFEEVIWPTLAQRVPAFEALRPGAAWAGHYAYNTLDQNAILGPHPEIGNFWFANGFSGHGLQQSPAVGRYLSELAAFGEARTLDLATFGFERVTAGRPIREMNVV